MLKVRVGAVALAAAAVVACFGTTVLAQASSAPAAARQLPPGLAKHGHWTTVDGRRVWAVPLSLQVDRQGRMVAHAANNIWTSKLQNDNTGMCISSYPGGHGATVHQYACKGSANQRWEYIFDPGAAIWEFYNGGDGLCMDNYQGHNTNYNPQIMWGCAEGSAVPLAHVIGGGAHGGYLIHTLQALGQWSGYCMSGLGSRTDGSDVPLYVCSTSAGNQSWHSSTPLT